jgi:FHS family L-fucose permease-like MFS transporter
VRQDVSTEEARAAMLYDAQRFAGVTLDPKTQAIVADMQAKKEWSVGILNRRLLTDAYPGMVAFNDSVLTFSDRGASFLASLGFFCFLAGRVIGAALLKKFPAHKVLCAFACCSGLCSLLVFLKLGWVSAVALFLTYLFMSITFPTIFSLGIHGLGSRAKKASSFIVMAIMGGAIMPKLMGHIGDAHGMSTAFIVPTACFVLIALYAFFWSFLSGSEGVVGANVSKGH